MDEQQVQLQIVKLVQAALLQDPQAIQLIEKIMLAALLGNLQAAQIAQMILLVALLMQQLQQLQVRAARFGAKLNYIKLLKGLCPEGYKMEYFKNGGRLCKRCTKAHQDGGEVEQTPSTVAERFKMEAAKCGKKMKKKENGGAVESEKCGGKPKLKKKKLNKGGVANTPYVRKKTSDYDWVDTKTDSKGRTSQRIVTEDGTLYKGRNGKTGLEGTLVGDSIRKVDGWDRAREKPRLKKKACGGSVKSLLKKRNN